MEYGSLYLLHLHFAAQKPAQRSHALVPNPAGHDERKGVQIRRNVQGKPVPRNPTPHSDSDRRHLLLADPNARPPANSTALQPQRLQNPDQRLLDAPKVPVDILPMPLQVEDGITDELAGTVIRDVAAARRL